MACADPLDPFRLAELFAGSVDEAPRSAAARRNAHFAPEWMMRPTRGHVPWCAHPVHRNAEHRFARDIRKGSSDDRPGLAGNESAQFLTASAVGWERLVLLVGSSLRWAGR